AASAVLDPESLAAFRRVCDLAPFPVLDDLTTARAKSVLADVELLITGWGCPPLDAEALRSAPRLRAVVHTAGSVRGHVTEACWERGVEVSSAAAANALPVAEYTLGMILLTGKRVLERARD
ncbi:hydroxyacid dehydrogenase, partial [Streptomyces sp. SID6013]|nr:hydroxyacid dehydrogenase [Streptomyces sp. SID6013]